MKRKKIAAALLAACLALSGVSVSAAGINADTTIGDVNRDGIIDIDDATLVQRFIAGIKPADADGIELRIADADGNGACDIMDVTAIQRYCAELPCGDLPVGKLYSAVYGETEQPATTAEPTEPSTAETENLPTIPEPSTEVAEPTGETTAAEVTTEPAATVRETEATSDATTEATTGIPTEAATAASTASVTEPVTEPEETTTSAPALSFLNLNAGSVKLGDNESFQLTAESDAALDASVLQFVSQNESVAKVDASGMITAVQKGETDVICRYGEMYNICHVTVCPAATALSLNQETLRLGVGEIFDLDSYVNGGAAAFYRAYSSDNEAVATVTEAGGFVTARSVGTANITCTLRNGVKAVCKLTVEPLATEISLNRTELTMGVGEVFDFNSTVRGGAAFFRTYSTDDESIVSVTESYGYATAQQVGVTNVRCTLISGVEAVCQITVKPLAPSLSLNRSSVTLAGGEQFDFNSSVPAGTAAYYRAYYSENPSVARIELEGGLLTAVREGTTRIYCEMQNGTRVYATIRVTPAVRKVMIDYLNEQIGNNNRSYINYINENSDYECHAGTHWCAVFAWCALDAVADRLGMSNPVAPCMYVSDIAEEARDEHALRNLADTGYVPSPGDLFLTANSAHPEYGVRNHIGFVEWVERNSSGRVVKVHTIEGNYGWETESPSVTRVTRSVLYPDEKDDYGMFICEYINIEYLFPNT